MKSFSRYANTQTGIVVVWGRFNPPTIGHESMFNEAARVANSREYPLRIHATHSAGDEKNPLLYEKKISYMKTLFPRYREYIREDATNNIAELIRELSESYSNVIMVCGEDRREAYENLVERMELSNVEIYCTGKRDPDGDLVESMSATFMRECVKSGDFTNFRSGLPSNTSVELARSLFEDVRKGMGLKEKHLPVALKRTEEREKFFSGELVSVGDDVTILKTGEQGKVSVVGANYVIVESNGNKQRLWAKDIKRTNENARTT